MSARMTALQKSNGRVRGIATGDVFRRLVSKALAQQFAGVFNEATAPFQFALQTRAPPTLKLIQMESTYGFH